MIHRSFRRLFSTVSQQPLKLDISTLEQIRNYLKDVFPLTSKVFLKHDTFFFISSTTGLTMGSILYLNIIQNQKFDRIEQQLDKINDKMTVFQEQLYELKSEIHDIKLSQEKTLWKWFFK